MADSGVDLDSLRSIVSGATTRWLKVIGTNGAESPVPGLEWNIGELAAHMVSAAESMEVYLRDQTPPPAPYSELSSYNRARLERLPTGDLRELALRLRDAVVEFLDDTGRRPPATTLPWFDGHIVDISTATALLAGELLVHGRDLAHARGVSWPIPAPEARQVMLGMLPAAAASFDPSRAHHRLHARIRMWGGGTFGVRVSASGLAVTDGADAADVTVWAHPATLLLMMFGRISVPRAALSGRSLAWGRRPWVAVEIPRLFRT